MRNHSIRRSAVEWKLFSFNGKTCFKPGVKSAEKRMHVVPATFFEQQRHPGA